MDAHRRLFNSPSNPRQNDAAVPHVLTSLKRFGWQQPVVAKRSGEVVAGNTRRKAARELGAKEVPVVWLEGSDLDATAYAIADNPTHEFASWDDASLARETTAFRRRCRALYAPLKPTKSLIYFSWCCNPRESSQHKNLHFRTRRDHFA
jgi:hypothetical protein